MANTINSKITCKTRNKTGKIKQNLKIIINAAGEFNSSHYSKTFIQSNHHLVFLCLRSVQLNKFSNFMQNKQQQKKKQEGHEAATRSPESVLFY